MSDVRSNCSLNQGDDAERNKERESNFIEALDIVVIVNFVADRLHRKG